MERDAKILLTGQEGMISSATLRHLSKSGFTNVIRGTSAELDLIDQKTVREFFCEERPDYVFLTAGKSGGIMANIRHSAEFIYNNLQTQTNIIHSAWMAGVRKLLFLASSCIYPKGCPQPMKEDYLLSGKVEPTSEAYAIAKIAGIKMCQSYNSQYGTNFICAVPADIYGPDDDFDLETSHVLAALIRKLHEAKVHNQEKVIVWGTGSPRREFLHVDDLADACVFLINNYDRNEIVNVGFGEDVSIRELALMTRDIVGFSGDIVFDESKPNGALRKFLDSKRLRKTGWTPKIGLEEGIKRTYEWYILRGGAS